MVQHIQANKGNEKTWARNHNTRPFLFRQGTGPLSALQKLANQSATVRRVNALQDVANKRYEAIQLESMSDIRRDKHQPETLIQCKSFDSKTDIPLGRFTANLVEGQNKQIARDEDYYGVDAKIEFRPHEKASDIKLLEMVQVVRAQTGEPLKDIEWGIGGGKEARRDKLKTEASEGVKPGFFLDHLAEHAAPRTYGDSSEKGDVIPSSYVDNVALKMDAINNQHGSKTGKEIKSAKMADFPSSPNPYSFDAETVAMATHSEGVKGSLGTFAWGFKTKRGAGKKLELDGEISGRFEKGNSKTFNIALNKFNDVYRNPKSSISPENIDKLLLDYEKAESEDKKNGIKKILSGLIILAKKHEPPERDGLSTQGEYLKYWIQHKLRILDEKAESSSKEDSLETEPKPPIKVEFGEFQSAPTAESGALDGFEGFDKFK